MSALQKKHEQDSTNKQAAEVAKALEQKREAVATALKDAPQGRHAQEIAGLKDARERLAGMSAQADRPAVDAFFDRQLDRLKTTQQAELDIGKSAVAAAGPVEGRSPEDQQKALDDLRRAVDAIGTVHEDTQQRLAAERSELEQALSVKDTGQRAALIDDLRQRQTDDAAALNTAVQEVRFEEAFREGPGETWSAAEEEQREQAGATDALRRDPEAFLREQGWKLPDSVLKEALDKLELDEDRRRELTDLVAEQRRDGAALGKDAKAKDAVADMKKTPRSADEATNPNSHMRGNLGERAATEWLAANGFSILDYKPTLQGTTKPGIDMVAMKDDTLYLLDNKALSRSGDVRSVSALTKNFDDNLASTKRDLEQMAGDAKRSSEERAVIRKALDALEQGRYVRAVTNANVTHDDRRLQDVTEALKKAHKLEFIDVMTTDKEKAAAAAAKQVKDEADV